MLIIMVLMRMVSVQLLQAGVDPLGQTGDWRQSSECVVICHP